MSFERQPKIGQRVAMDDIHQALLVCAYLALPTSGASSKRCSTAVNQCTSCSDGFMADTWRRYEIGGARDGRHLWGTRTADQHRAGVRDELHGRAVARHNGVKLR